MSLDHPLRQTHPIETPGSGGVSRGGRIAPRVWQRFREVRDPWRRVVQHRGSCAPAAAHVANLTPSRRARRGAGRGAWDVPLPSSPRHRRESTAPPVPSPRGSTRGAGPAPTVVLRRRMGRRRSFHARTPGAHARPGLDGVVLSVDTAGRPRRRFPAVRVPSRHAMAAAHRQAGRRATRLAVAGDSAGGSPLRRGAILSRQRAPLRRDS